MIEIVPCRTSHLRELAHTIRAEERAEIAAVNMKPRHVMMDLYRQTPQPWAAVENGQVVAAWGDSAPVLAREGHVWIFTSSMIEAIPFTFAREARRWMAHYLEGREVIRSGIGVGCTRALRFYRMLGFEIGEPADGFHEIRVGRTEES